jgi:hypothetical protein
VAGEQVVEDVVPVVEAPPLGGEPRGAGGSDVPRAVIDEEDGRGLRADTPGGLGEERQVWLGGAQFPGVAADVEQAVVAERLAHVRGPVPLLVGAEVDAVPAKAQGAHHGEGRGRRLHAQPYALVDVRDRDSDPELGEDHRQDRQVVALPGERRQLSLIRPFKELKRPLPEVRLGCGDPAARKVLQHPVRVEHDMPDGKGAPLLVAHNADDDGSPACPARQRQLARKARRARSSVTPEN